MRAGVKEFLPQPVRLEDLVAALDRIGNQRFGRGDSKSRGSTVIAVGGATGGVIGALIGAGIPEYRAKVYDAELRGGGILIGMEARADDEIEKLEELLEELGGQHVRAE